MKRPSEQLDAMELFAEEIPVEYTELSAEPLPQNLLMGVSTLSSAGSLSSVASAPTASTGSSLGTASTWMPG